MMVVVVKYDGLKVKQERKPNRTSVLVSLSLSLTHIHTSRGLSSSGWCLSKFSNPQGRPPPLSLPLRAWVTQVTTAQ